MSHSSRPLETFWLRGLALRETDGRVEVVVDAPANDAGEELVAIRELIADSGEADGRSQPAIPRDVFESNDDPFRRPPGLSKVVDNGLDMAPELVLSLWIVKKNTDVGCFEENVTQASGRGMLIHLLGHGEGSTVIVFLVRLHETTLRQ